MEIYQLEKSGCITVLSRDIALWKANEGIQIDKKIMESLLAKLDELFPDGAKLIIDKCNSYSVDSDVIIASGKVKNIHAAAFIIYNNRSFAAAATQLSAVKLFTHKPIKIFRAHQGVKAAVEWLNRQPPERNLASLRYD